MSERDIECNVAILPFQASSRPMPCGRRLAAETRSRHFRPIIAALLLPQGDRPASSPFGAVTKQGHQAGILPVCIC
jgi:hypothetical protein